MKHGYQRFNQYPKGSTLWLHIRCYDEVVSEQELLKKFDERYQRNNEFGREYFIGDVHDMMEVILQYVGHTCNLSSMVEEHSKQIELFQIKLNNQTVKFENEKLLLQKELARAMSQIEEYMIKLRSLPNTEHCSMDIDSKENRSYCKECKLSFANRDSYLRHKKNSCRGVEKTVCSICFKRFNSSHGRAKHIRKVQCVPPLSESGAPTSVCNQTTNDVNNMGICWSTSTTKHATCF